MTTIQFAYKELIQAHHLQVPYRNIEIKPQKSLNHNKKNPLDDNLIIHGDNLEALKALLPKYAGKIDCIYIDPPYNIGNEKLVYNDNVNHPVFKEWLGKTIDSEDLERHDKWCCMMWTRLELLKELLDNNGCIFISIDDTEQHRLRMMMDELFGENNLISEIAWHSKYTTANDKKFISMQHEYIIVYAKNKDNAKFNLLPRTEKADNAYKNPDNDPRGKWKSTPLHAKSGRKNTNYKFTKIRKFNGDLVKPFIWSAPKGRFPRYNNETLARLESENRITCGKNGTGVPNAKTFLNEVKQGIIPGSLWKHEDVGHTHEANEELSELMGKGVFDNPKPQKLIKQVLGIGTKKDSIILDSFAGSGTTAHAVLSLNKEDGGTRKFILIEQEDYADKITAERVRRVIKGIHKSRNEQLRKGLGGSFTYCTLGKPVDTEKMLTGESLPDFSTLASFLLYQSYGISTTKPLKPKLDGMFYSDDTRDFYLIYKPDIKYLQNNSVLTEKKADKINKKNREAVIFASDKQQSQRELSKLNITFCRLPDVVMGATDSAS